MSSQQTGKEERIFCFDIDMTLLQHPERKITESAVRAIQNLREACPVKIVLATGRVVEQPDVTGTLEAIRPDAVIHSNGQLVTLYHYEPEAARTVLFSSPIPKELLAEILDFAASRGIDMGSGIRGKEYYLSRGNARRLLEGDCYSVAMRGDREKRMLLESRFPGMKALEFSDGSGADFVREGFDKSVGMEHLLAYWKMDWRQVTAFGDSRNDVELLQRAGLGIAMGNAVAEAKKAADYITDDIRRDGVQKGIAYALSV